MPTYGTVSKVNNWEGLELAGKGRFGEIHEGQHRKERPRGRAGNSLSLLLTHPPREKVGMEVGITR